MRKPSFFFMLLPCLAFGCSETVDVTPPGTTDPSAATATPAADDAMLAGTKDSTSGDSMTVLLTADNTKVEFIGTHVGEKPDPRKGSIATLTGEAHADGTNLTSLKVEFDMESIATEFDKLTEHLKSPDFFDVKENPTAKFESTLIEKNPDGTVNIIGDLTLLRTTKQIHIPATVDLSDGVKLKAEFVIDRTEFGMNFGEDKVEKSVQMMVTVGG